MSDLPTPRGAPAKAVPRRNILEALSGSRSGVETRSVAQQKAEKQAQETNRIMEKNLEALVDRRRDMLYEKLERMSDSLEAESVSVHLLKLYDETLRRTADDFEKLYSEISLLLPKDQRSAHRTEYSTFEKLHNLQRNYDLDSVNSSP